MVRLIFRILSRNGICKYHTAEVVGEKASLLVEAEGVTLVGVEDCHAKDSLKSRVELGPDGEYLVPRDLQPALEEMAASARMEHEIVDSLVKAGNAIFQPSKDRSMLHGNGSEETTGGVEVTQASVPAPGLSHDPVAEFWVLLNTKTGKFVETTTTEGGVAYIVCPSLQEAEKVVEQQKIYDIESRPIRIA